MTYRLLVVTVAIALILLLLLGFWTSAKLFLRRHGAPDSDRAALALRLMAWSFAGFGVGLIGVGIGGPVLATLAYAYTARELTGVSWPTGLLWGFVTSFLNALIVGGLLAGLVLNQ